MRELLARVRHHVIERDLAHAPLSERSALLPVRVLVVAVLGVFRHKVLVFAAALTYISIVSTTTIAKAVRVRFREGRAARPVLDFNLYLGPNDVWTAAVVPIEALDAPPSGGARLLTADRSCTDPPFATSNGIASVDFRQRELAGSSH